MPVPRSKYQEPADWSRAAIERVIAADEPDTLLRVPIAVSMRDEDWKYAQDICVRLARHPHFNVRGNAVLGFGHIARIHRKLDKKIVFPIIAAALKDKEDYVRGQAHSAKDDTELFLRWKYEKKRPNKAPEPTTGTVTICAECIFDPMPSRKAQLAPVPVVAHL